MAEQFRLRSMIRGDSASVINHDAKMRYCHLGSEQPLILLREPTNAKDQSAVLVTDLLGGPVGYVCREHAALVARKMDAGEILLCKTVGPCLCIRRFILIWSEGEEATEVEARFKIKGRRRAKVTVKFKELTGPNDPGSDGWGSQLPIHFNCRCSLERSH